MTITSTTHSKSSSPNSHLDHAVTLGDVCLGPGHVQRHTPSNVLPILLLLGAGHLDVEVESTQRPALLHFYFRSPG